MCLMKSATENTVMLQRLIAMLLILGKLIFCKYNTKESITTDCRMFWPGRLLLVSCTRRSGFRGVGGRGRHLVTFTRFLWGAGMQPSLDVTAHP